MVSVVSLVFGILAGYYWNYGDKRMYDAYNYVQVCALTQATIAQHTHTQLTHKHIPSHTHANTHININTRQLVQILINVGACFIVLYEIQRQKAMPNNAQTVELMYVPLHTRTHTHAHILTHT